MLAAQLCPTLCDSLDCSQPGSFAYRILQARILEWVSISFSRWSSWSGIKPRLPMLQADSLSSEPLSKPSIVKKKNIPIFGHKTFNKLIWEKALYGWQVLFTVFVGRRSFDSYLDCWTQSRQGASREVGRKCKEEL